MLKPSQIQVIFFSFLLVSCAGGPANANAQPEEPAFIIITKNPEDDVSVQIENSTTLIDIQSLTGIGSASFELETGTMPEHMTVRLHLKGLEQFRLLSDQDQISASFSGSDALNLDQTILSAGTESPLLPGHPLWMEIAIVSEAGEKIPLEDGYFEVTVPQEFIQNAGTIFEIEWIDFYR